MSVSLMSGDSLSENTLGVSLSANASLEVSMYPKGESGATFTPSVSDEGVISWTNDRNKVNPPSKNIKGPTSTITIGTVTSGPTASVVNSGTENDAIFDICMPEYGTALTVNGSESGREAEIYAPINSGVENQILISQGENENPIWINDNNVKITGNQSIEGTKSFSDRPLYNNNNIITTEDYASTSVGGTIKVNDANGTQISNGTLIGSTRTFAQYQNDNNNLLISKGTLENTLTGKNFITTSYHDTTKQNVLTQGNHINITNDVITAVYDNASTTQDGLMSAVDKTKLNGIATGATANTVENNLTSTSTTNALSAYQGKVINDKLNGLKIMALTQSQYDAITTKDSNTLYFII